MTKRIIVPLDQSDIAEQALPLARGLSKQLGSAVTLVSVLAVPAAFRPHIAGAAREPEPDPHRLAREYMVAPPSAFGQWSGSSTSAPTRNQIDRLAARSSETERYLEEISRTFEGTPVEISVQFGNPAERILHVAEQRENSVIILASHGRSGIGRALLGSVAWRVVQAATMPAFVVRGSTDPMAREGMISIENVLIPLDGSHMSETAISKVRRVFDHDNIRLHLLYVCEAGVHADPRVQEVSEDYQHANRSQADGYIEWLAHRLSTPGTPVTWEVADGPVPHVINRIAEERQSDLIAMTTHGRSGVSRFTLGSVAGQVLHQASRPLMLIRPKE